MTFTDFTDNPRVDIIDVTYSGTGLSLLYHIDGKDGWADGEFYIDDNDVLHHEVIAPDGSEIELKIKLHF